MDIKLYDFNTTERRLGIISWRPPKDEYAQNVLLWVLRVYTYLLPPGRYMYPELADVITQHYDANTPQTAEAIRILKEC